MGWNGHFVECTNWVTCKDSGPGVWWGLRKIAWGMCNDKVSEKEGTSEIREANFLHRAPGETEAKGWARPASNIGQGGGRTGLGLGVLT